MKSSKTNSLDIRLPRNSQPLVLESSNRIWFLASFKAACHHGLMDGPLFPSSYWFFFICFSRTVGMGLQPQRF
jgi:hypothetical protein